MRIDKKTKWVEFAPFVNEERMVQLRDSITDCAIFDFWKLTIGEFSPLLNGELPAELQKQLENRDITVFEVIMIVNSNEKFLLEFQTVIDSYEIELEAEEKEASSFMPDFLPYENMLIFTQKYFGLNDFGSAEKISMLEYMIAKKSSYSDAIYQRALSHIQTRNMKRK